MFSLKDENVQKVYCEKMFTSLKRIIRSSWQSFWRQGGLTFATCFILVLAIFLIIFLFFLKNATDFAISDLENKVNISVYFQKETQEEDIFKIREEIAQIPEVASIDYVSRKAALEIFTERHKDDQLALDAINELGDNPFLASLSIKSKQIDQYEKISEFLKGIQPDGIIEQVDYFQRKPLIERVAAIASGIKTAGIVASLLLSIIAILITFNTIRLAILSQKEEIEIQRLVGASNWFIRGPFLAQGALAGIISALISFLLITVFAWILSPKVAYLFSDLNLLNLLFSNFWFLLLIQIVIGIALGVISSWLAVRKYLRV